MKFSYSLIKKMVPGLPGAKDFMEKFNAYGFEVEGVDGDTVEIKLPANRFADASSHWGIAKESAAIWNTKVVFAGKASVNLPKKGTLSVKVEEPALCPRYAARKFKVEKNGASPKWMQEVLAACGLRPINLVVDVMNYVMLEVGQPLHAFDAAKVKEGKLVVRRAKQGEHIQTIDDHKHTLDKDVLVIADSEKPLAIAGIKGGKSSEVDHATTEIVVEAAYFEPVNIFKSAQKLKLKTDASVRFAHGLHPELVAIGMERASWLLRELADATLLDSAEAYPRKAGAEIIGLDLERLNRVLGTEFDAKAIAGYLKRLGFSVKPGKKGMLLAEVPVLRTDITIEEDVIEEVARIYGVANIKPDAPVSVMKPSEFDDEVKLKDVSRKILTALGASEVYNYSFLSRKEAEVRFFPTLPHELAELENPISEDKQYLRPSLLSGVMKNLESNFRYFDEVRVFEIGNVFHVEQGKMKEGARLAIGIASKKEPTFLELKGMLDELLRRIGLTDYFMKPVDDHLIIETDHSVLGYMKPVSFEKKQKGAIAELDFGRLAKLVEGEKEYEALPKFPGITRDISLFVPREVRVGDLLEAINSVPTKFVEDVDMVDFYEDPNQGERRKSITFRIVFQSDERTLTDAEVGDELSAILSELQGRFQAEVR